MFLCVMVHNHGECRAKQGRLLLNWLTLVKCDEVVQVAEEGADEVLLSLDWHECFDLF